MQQMRTAARFRIWDLEGQVFRDHVWFVNNATTVYNELEYNDFPRYILQQSTGIYDKNKEEIFEGDMVELEVGEIKEVSRNNIGLNDFCMNGLGGEELKVVGNIFQCNPE